MNNVNISGFVCNLNVIDGNYGKIAFFKIKNVEKRKKFQSDEIINTTCFIDCTKYNWGNGIDDNKIKEGMLVICSGKLQSYKPSDMFKKYNNAIHECWINRFQVEDIVMVVQIKDEETISKSNNTTTSYGNKDFNSNTHIQPNLYQQNTKVNSIEELEDDIPF